MVIPCLNFLCCFLFPYLYRDSLTLVAGTLLSTYTAVYPIVYWYVRFFGGGLSFELICPRYLAFAMVGIW